MRRDTIESFRREGVVRSVERALLLAGTLGGSGELNCVAELDDTAAQQARSLERDGDRTLPLFGVPVLIKDNIDVRGLHTTAGSLALADNIAASDAPVVRNLRRNGAVMIGKTNMTEFANYTTTGMPGGYSSRGGQVIHAIDRTASPSGSSSGSGVAVCAGIVPAAVGTDTSFSVIACAQSNGICGLKPPAGALSHGGIIPIARTLDSAGAMANCFADALTLYSAMRDVPLPAVIPARLSGMKIAVNTANADKVSDGQTAFLGRTLDRLRDSGVQTSEIEQPYSPLLSVIMKWEFREHLEDYLHLSASSRKTLREIVGYYEENPDTMLRYGDTLLRAALDEAPGGTNGAPYLEAMRSRAETAAQVTAEISGYDAVIMTGPTNIMHFCGLPSVTVTGQECNESGVPRGLIMYGCDELRLYAAALAIERIFTEI